MNILRACIVFISLSEAANSNRSDDTIDIVHSSATNTSDIDKYDRLALQMIPDFTINPTNSSTYPFLAAVLTNDYQYICSASLVSYKMFLTASSCANLRVAYILFPKTSGIKTNDSIIANVTKMLVYRSEEYVQDMPVAILFTIPYDFIPGVQPIFVSDDVFDSTHQNCTAIGFGLDLLNRQSRIMQHVLLEHNKKALDPKNETMRCFNDLGAPVISNFELIGVVTKGIDGCTNDVTKGSVVEVTLAVKFYNWVERLIEKEANSTDQLINVRNMRAIEEFDYDDSGTTCNHDEYSKLILLVASVMLLRNF